MGAELSRIAEQAEAARRAQADHEEAEQARAAREAAEAQAREEREHAERLAQEVEEERRRQRVAEEAAGRAVIVAQQEQERRQRAREEENRRLHAEREAAQEARQAQAPTPEEYSAFKEVIQHTEGFFHVALSGIAGSGKSSLVNSFCGKHNMDLDAAAVGANNTNFAVARYPDPHPFSRFVWYDVPGAGTLKVPDWNSFNDQGLFVFDSIIVVVNNSFTATDVAILSNARRFGISAFIVRSKADQHIRNLMKDIGYNSDDEGGNKASYFARARDQYVTDTARSIRTNLQEAKLPDQPVYLVSNIALQAAVTGRASKKMLDEVKLLTDLGGAARRYAL